jgi:hypothetical protein
MTLLESFAENLKFLEILELNYSRFLNFAKKICKSEFRKSNRAGEMQEPPSSDANSLLHQLIKLNLPSGLDPVVLT